MGFFQTMAKGYGIIFKSAGRKLEMVAPKALSGMGNGLMMIGSAVMAKTAMKDETRDIIAECDAAIEEAKQATKDAKKTEKAKKVGKKYVLKAWKITKTFRKGIIMEAVGAACNIGAVGISENGKKKALTACAALGAQFAGYRAAVRDDLGAEADTIYMSGGRLKDKNLRIDAKTGEISRIKNEKEDAHVDENGDITLKKDPNAFRFWFSRETCPSIWCDNYDLRLSKLEWVEDTLNLQLRGAGHISLNDMRREFGGLIPKKMDVGIGGIFGVTYDGHKRINLHFRDDQDFMEGRTDSCWIIFDCDPEPIIGKINTKLTEVEQ